MSRVCGRYIFHVPGCRVSIAFADLMLTERRGSLWSWKIGGALHAAACVH